MKQTRGTGRRGAPPRANTESDIYHKGWLRSMNQCSASSKQHPVNNLACQAADMRLNNKLGIQISGLPHEFLHDFLHPHLQAYEADAIAPPQPEQVQQIPVGLLQNHLLAVKHSRLTRHAATILQTLRGGHTQHRGQTFTQIQKGRIFILRMFNKCLQQ